jgi:hypothetical protein
MSSTRSLVLSLVFVAAPALLHAGDLTPRDVVELHRSGLGEEVLLALIEVDGGPFDLTTSDVLDLKAEGLPERVIAALIRAGRGGYAPESAPHPRDEPVTGDPAYETDTWTTYETHHTEIVAVPVPVYVPVAHPRRRQFHAEPDAQAISVPGVRRGRPADRLGTAPGVARGSTVTADDIRHAPPGFHPVTPARAQDPATTATPRVRVTWRASPRRAWSARRIAWQTHRLPPASRAAAVREPRAAAGQRPSRVAGPAR